MSHPPPRVSRAIEQEMASLLAIYHAELPAKLGALRDALHAARTSPANLSLLDLARDQAHTLRGSAGCHGAPIVGRHAGRIEDLLVAMAVAEQASDPSGVWAEVDWALEQALAAAPGYLRVV